MSRQEFSAKIKALAFKRANGCCERCGGRLYVGKFRYDHDIPDQMGGEPILENCVVACTGCDTPKTAKDQGDIAKAKRRERKHAGIKKNRTITAWRRFNGTVVRMPRER